MGFKPKLREWFSEGFGGGEKRLKKRKKSNFFGAIKWSEVWLRFLVEFWSSSSDFAWNCLRNRCMVQSVKRIRYFSGSFFLMMGADRGWELDLKPFDCVGGVEFGFFVRGGCGSGIACGRYFCWRVFEFGGRVFFFSGEFRCLR